jgi:hypothetical protein
VLKRVVGLLILLENEVGCPASDEHHCVAVGA